MEDTTTEVVKTFEIGNDLNAVSDVVTQIVEMSSHLFENIYMLEVAIYEAIYNAIEHGNLEISKKKKEKMIEEGNYDDFLSSRCATKKCAGRIVKIRSIVSEKSQTIEIEDGGGGFDWRSEMKNVIAQQNKFPSGFNGFGIKIIAAVFNVLEYNEKGNLLRLVKFTDRIRREDNVKENSNS
jgi:anti-sigma regulatory factor (Ser/Thr protein kinase)